MPARKISISVDEKTYESVQEAVRSGDFRSMSHLFEDGAKLVLHERAKRKGESNPCEALA
jgi:Arc/MetJ-type ribon-helix-helix transcriptional regulator